MVIRYSRAKKLYDELLHPKNRGMKRYFENIEGDDWEDHIPGPPYYLQKIFEKKKKQKL